MKKKSTDMDVTVQRRYPRDIGYGQTNAIPRDTKYDLKRVQSRTHFGYDECAFESEMPGNSVWTEEDRP
jgi:hypothetical protein